MSQRERRRGPPGDYFIHPQGCTKTTGHFLFFPPLRGVLSAMWLQMPGSVWDTGGCAVSGKSCLAFYGLVKRSPEAVMSTHKKTFGNLYLCLVALW